MSKIVAIVAIAGILAGLTGYVLIPSVSPIPTIRDGDGDGVVDAEDFWQGDGGLLVIVERFEVDGTEGSTLLVVLGEKVCTNPSISVCPPPETVSFRLTVEIANNVHTFIGNGTWEIGIPEDTETVAVRLEAGAVGINLVPNPTRNVLSSPFKSTAWTTTQFEVASQVLTGNLTYSVVATGCPCGEEFLQGSYGTDAWPPPFEWPGPGTTPAAIGVSVSQTPNGLNWALTFASVPAGMTPASVSLVVFAASGTILLSKTALPSLSGDAAYSPIDPAAVYINAGDRILLSTSAFPTGSTYQLVDANGVLASGTL